MELYRSDRTLLSRDCNGRTLAFDLIQQRVLRLPETVAMAYRALSKDRTAALEPIKASGLLGGDETNISSPLSLSLLQLLMNGPVVREPSLPPVDTSLWLKGRSVRLPPPQHRSDSFAEVVKRRRSETVSLDGGLTLSSLSEILHLSVMETEQRRPYGSPGACYPIHTFYYHSSIPDSENTDLSPGFYFVDPLRSSLVEIRSALLPDPIRNWAQHAVGAVNISDACFCFFIAEWNRTLRKYGSGGVTLVLKEIGGITQQLHLAATACGQGARAIGGSIDSLLSPLIGYEFPALSHLGTVALG